MMWLVRMMIDYEDVPEWDDVSEELNIFKEFLWSLDDETAYKIMRKINRKYCWEVVNK